jgi:hypothetical protein
MSDVRAARESMTEGTRRASRPPRARWILATLALLVTSAGRAEPMPIHSASPENLAKLSSHVGVFDWMRETRRFRIVTWLRGTWPTAEIEVHGLSDLVAAHLSLAGEPTQLGLFGDDRVTLTGRVVLFLEALDGRLHHTGMRRYGGIGGAHASARFLTKEGPACVLLQLLNPGDPMLAPEGSKTEKALLENLSKVLAAHPYDPPGPPRPVVPEAHRAAFFAALRGTIDWYQGDWPTEIPGFAGSVAESKAITETANLLRTWMLAVKPKDRLAGLDALLLLARVVQGGGPDASRAIAVAHEMLPTLDALAAKDWILAELRHGDYYTNRTELARLAKVLGPTAYEAALGELEAWVERTEINEGTASWSALVRLGHQDRADAAKARREAREKAEAEPRK